MYLNSTDCFANLQAYFNKSIDTAPRLTHKLHLLHFHPRPSLTLLPPLPGTSSLLLRIPPYLTLPDLLLLALHFPLTLPHYLLILLHALLHPSRSHLNLIPLLLLAFNLADQYRLPALLHATLPPLLLRFIGSLRLLECCFGHITGLPFANNIYPSKPNPFIDQLFPAHFPILNFLPLPPYY